MAELFGTDIAPDALTEEERRSRMFGAAPTPSPTRYAGATASPTVPSAPVPNASDTSVTPGLRAAREEIGTSAMDKATPAGMPTSPTSTVGMRPTATADQPAKPKLGGWKDGLLKALDVAGQIALPNVEENIPGSAGYKRLQEQRGVATQEKQLGLRKSSADIENTQAETGLRRAQTEAALKPGPTEKNVDQIIAEATQDAINRGVDPNTDTKVLQAIDVKQRGQKEPAAKPDTAVQEQQRYEGIQQKMNLKQPVQPADAAWAKGYEKNKTLGPYAAAAAQAPQKSTERSDRSFQYNNSALDKVATPIDQAQGRLGRLNDAIAQNSPQADALIAPELLSVMAGGAGSGLRMNEAEISRIVGGRSKWESLKAAINQWSTDPSKANSITPEQRQQIRALVKTVQDKLNAKQQIIDESRNSLIDADDPKEHRRIVSETKKQLDAIDAGEGGNAGSEKAFTQADVDAAVTAHPGSNAQQIEQAFISKGWKKK